MSQQQNESRAVIATRRADLDWLRLLGVLCVFLFHCCKVFSYGGWFIVDADRSWVATILAALLRHWMMPLLFAVSGAALYHSLRQRSRGVLLRERFLRLMVPFLTLGLLVFGPLQIYIDRLSAGTFRGSFLAFFGQYFDGLDAFGGHFAWHGMHMWYLLFLFGLTVLWLPLLLPGRRSGPRALDRVGRVPFRLWMLLVLLISLVGADMLGDWLDPGGFRASGGWTIFTYALCLPIGYLLASSARWQKGVHRLMWLALGLGVTTSALDLVIRYAWRPPIAYRSWAYFGLILMANVRLLAWVIALFGLASRFLDRRHRLARRLNEGLLPFYILHQPAILVIGHFAVLRWNVSVAVKFAALAILSIAAILILYALIRRVRVLRLLFGLRLADRP